MASTGPSRLKTRACYFKLPMKEKFDIYLLWLFSKMLWIFPIKQVFDTMVAFLDT